MSNNTLIWIRAIFATIGPACIGVGTALVIHENILLGCIVYAISLISFAITIKLEKSIYGK